MVAWCWASQRNVGGTMEYIKASSLTVKTGDFRKGGRWRGTMRGEKSCRIGMWMRRGKRKRSWSYNPDVLTPLEQLINRTLVAEEKMVTPYQDPTYGEIVPVMSSFALVEEAVKLYGVCPDGTDGTTRHLVSLDVLKDEEVHIGTPLQQILDET